MNQSPLEQAKEGEAVARPNIFALPNQTAILFGLIVAVLLGALIIGSLDRRVIPIWPLAAALFILSWRAFFAHADRLITRLGLVSAAGEFPRLQQSIERLAHEVGLRQTLTLRVTKRKGVFRTFGTFRHWTMACSRTEAERLEKQLQTATTSPIVEARLVHELYHFKTGDYWQTRYTRDLLAKNFLLSGWVILFFVGLTLLLFVSAPAVMQLDPDDLATQMASSVPELRDFFLQLLPSAADFEELRERAANFNVGLTLFFFTNTFLPFILIGGILWAFYWPKLWRVRELYADAGIAHNRGSMVAFLSAMFKIPPDHMQRYPLPLNVLSNSNSTGRLKRWLKQPRSFHYDNITRIACILDPTRVFGNWIDTAVLLGGLILLLDILLASPLTLLFIGSWPMHFITLIIFTTVSLRLLPVVVQGHSGWAYMFKVVGAVMALRLALILFTLGLLISSYLIDPVGLGEMLAAFIAAIAGTNERSDALFFDDLTGFILSAAILNLAQVGIVLLVLTVSLAIMIIIFRRLLTWYSFPQAKERLMKTAYLVIGICVLLLGLSILPVVTVALLDPINLPNPVMLALTITGAIVALFGLWLLWKVDRQYSGRCPACGSAVPGYFRLGMRCPVSTCSELLHPWLLAPYEV